MVDLTSVETSSNLSGTVPKAKKRSAADAMNRYIDVKESSFASRNVAGNTKAMAIQLDSFMNGCNQLLLLEEKRANQALTEEQQKIISRMSSVVGSAVANLETHIKSGTLWCHGDLTTPSSNLQDQTPISSNTTINSNSTVAVRRRLLLTPADGEQENVNTDNTFSVDSDDDLNI